MKVIVLRLKREFQGDNLLAAISCLIISITIFFVMAVLNRQVLL
ncbi:MAG: hypothetical protein AB3N14_07320 [Flavobacteriaceae bacterium]